MRVSEAVARKTNKMSSSPTTTTTTWTWTSTTTKFIPRAAYDCILGQQVQCPGVPGTCKGNQCCSDGATCPSAGDDFHSVCKWAKKETCLRPGSAGTIVRRFEEATDIPAQPAHRSVASASAGRGVFLTALAALALLVPALIRRTPLPARGCRGLAQMEAERVAMMRDRGEEQAEA